MPATVNIGTLEGLLRWKVDGSELNSSLNEVARKANVSRAQLDKYNKELLSITTSYNKVAASLDPVAANTQKYDRSQVSLSNALKAGIIDQKEFNRLLDLSKEKYLSTTIAQKSFAKSLESIGSGLSQIGTSLTFAISAPLGIVSKLAIDSGRNFESSFAGVRKTVDGTRQELEKLAQGLRDLAAGPDPIPIDINKLNEVAENAGQLGIARDDIVSFTRVMADLGETTNLTAIQASDSVSRFQNIFSAAGKETDRFGSTLVALGNAGASTEREILEMGLRIAGAGKQIGLTQGEVMAFASALSSLGIEAEMGGSALSIVMSKISMAVERGGRSLSNFAQVVDMSGEEFRNAFKADAAQTLSLFVDGLAAISREGGSVVTVLDDLGIKEVRQRDALQRLIGAGDLLKDSLALQAKAWEENNALTIEAEKRYQTFDSQLQLFKNELNDVGITLGTSLLPVLRDILDLTKPLISAMSSMAQTFGSLPDPIKFTAVAMGGLVIAAGPVLFVTGQLLQSYASLLLISPKVAATFPLIGRSITALLGPWGLLAAAITTATIAVSTFIENWKSKMQAQIDQMVEDTNRLGVAFDRLNKIKISKSASSSDLQSMSDELAQISDQLEKATKEQQRNLTNVSIFYDRQIKQIEQRAGKETEESKLRKRQRDDELKSIKEAAQTEINGLNSRKKLLIESLRSVETITDAQEKLSGEVDITTKLEEKIGGQLQSILAQREIELQKLKELRELAAKGITDTSHRLKEEQNINDRYEYRLSLLKHTEQFGGKIGKQLADQEKLLKEMERKVKIELTLTAKLDPIKIKREDVFKFADESLREAVKRLDSIVEVEKKNTEAFRAIQEEHDRWIEDVAASWVEHFRSMKDIAEGEMEAVREAVERGLLSTVEGERALAQIRAELYSAQIDKFSGFVGTVSSMLSELGGSFGKFFAQITQITSSVQNVNQTANSLGGWSTAMGAWGGTIAAFVELYKFADSVIQKHKGEKYGTRGGLSITGGTTVSSFTSQDSLGLTRAIQDVLKAFEDQLRISVSDLEAIEIRVRNNGSAVQAWVKGVWVGTFSDVNTAIREALMVAIKDPSSSLRGMSDIMAEGLSRWTSPDMEGLLSFLTDLRAISDLSLSPLVIDLQKSFVQFNALRESLNKLDQSSEAVIRSQKELTDAQNYLYKQTKAQLLGIDLSAVDALKNLAGFQKGMEDVGNTAKSGLESALQAAENRLEQLERTATGLPTSSGGGQGIAGPQDPGSNPAQIVRLFSDFADDIGDEKERLKASIQDLKEQISNIPKALSEKEIDLGIFSAVEDDLRKLPQYSSLVIEMERERIKFKYEELRLQLIGMGAWERWEGVWKDLYNAAMAEAGKSPTAGSGRRGGGGGNSDKDNVRDFIKDTKFDLSLTGLSDYQKSLKELDRQYDDLIKQAGNDKKLKEQLLNLKEKELDLLKKENTRETRESFREFMGLVTPFDKIRKSAKDLVKEIQGSALGDPEKAAKIGRVMDEVERQLDDLAKETAVGLLGSLLSDMQRFGATEEQMLAARTQMAILEHQIKMANFAKEIAILEAEGRLTDEQMAVIKGAYDFLRGIDPNAIITPANDNNGEGGRSSSISYSSNAFDDFESMLKSVQDKLTEWNRIPLSENLAKAHELTDSFKALMIDVEKLKPYGWDYTQQAQDSFRAMVGDFIDDTLSEFEESGDELSNQLTAIGAKFTDINAAFVHLGASQEDLLRAEQARLTAVDKALRQYLDPIKERRESRLIGERSILTGEQQFFEAQKQFRELFAQIQSGDLTNLTDTVRLADQYEDLLRSFTAGEGVRFGIKEIDDALLAIENLVPGFAQEMAEVGTEANPMYTNDSGIIDAMHSNMEAVNTGNTLMLDEMRTSVSEMKIQTQKLDGIEAALYGTINVKNVA